MISAFEFPNMSEPMVFAEDPFVRLAKHCPRNESAEAHRRGDYYHAYNRTGVCCVFGDMPRSELHKYIGAWGVR